jgi:hypothetical protein
VSEAACTSPGGHIPTCCIACLDTCRTVRAAHTHAAQVDQIAEQEAIEVCEAVATEPIVDVPFHNATDATELIATDPIVDNPFHDATGPIVPDLPQESALTVREKTIVRRMRDRLADIDMLGCRTCRERAFNISISNASNECTRCRPSPSHRNVPTIVLHGHPLLTGPLSSLF